MLKLHNIRMKMSNVRKNKIKELPNVTKVQSLVMLVAIKCEKKNKRTTKCDQSTVIYDAGTAQYKEETVKCEKKRKEKETIKCDKNCHM